MQDATSDVSCDDVALEGVWSVLFFFFLGRRAESRIVWWIFKIFNIVDVKAAASIGEKISVDTWILDASIAWECDNEWQIHVSTMTVVTI